MLHKIIYPILIFLISILVVLVMYLNHRDIQNDYYYLRLSGESTHWKLTDYQIEIDPKNTFSGNGILYFKSENGDHTTQYYNLSMRAIINNEETSLHGQIVSGPEYFQNGVKIGSIEGPSPITKSGDSLTFKDIDEIYTVIRWDETGSGNTQEETILLYSKEVKE
ncbi:hypothetical protein [Sporosarcina sp. SAFN-015]|uniref:hypothetical protein n=1 Tax=Sporosarcina sp. SAFN-015 TaxID=3387274 RepID=UPI003F7E357F